MPFSRFMLHPDLLRAVQDKGFTRPTPIQDKAIPPVMAGKDIMATASTGSGKTAAFLLPILHRLIGKPRGVTRTLVLTPTRELAAQIHEHFEELAAHTRLKGATVFGGVGMAPQEKAFRAGVDVIVATPGRLLDHFQHPYARLNHLEVLVLDEADRMLDMGFLPDIRRILRVLPSKRQTLLFSATMPREIVTLASDMLHQPESVHIERKAAPASGVAHAVYPVPRDLKSELLAALLERGVIDDAIVFTRTKHRANRLAQFLERRGMAVGRIHGNRSQSQRTEALASFKTGRHKVLVATDIVARGIDVVELGHVVNFDVPADPDSYIHRVGRTARAENTGDAFTFVSPDEEADIRAVEKAIGRKLARVTLPDFDYQRKTHEKLEIPVHERLAAHRAQRKVAQARVAARTEGAAPRGGGHAPAHRDGSHKPVHRAGGGAHKTAHRKGGPGGAQSAHQPGHRGSSAHGRRQGGGGPHGSDGRLQAILDRHAPVTGSGAKGQGSTSAHRRSGR
jgi:ATP-dependent RNA helicase RhlE